MFFDFSVLPAPDRYKLMTSTIVPRPIAWVVTRSAAGRVNAAPFSFFNAFADDPPVLCVGIGGREGRHKDTGANLRETGEFVVNLVPERLMHAMHVTAIDFPSGIDELAEAGLTAVDSTTVGPPRIGESPVAFECVRHSLVELGAMRTLVVGLIKAMHVDDDVVDPARLRIDAAKLGLVGRTVGAGGYVRAAGPGLFELPRLTLTDWLRRR